MVMDLYAGWVVSPGLALIVVVLATAAMVSLAVLAFVRARRRATVAHAAESLRDPSLREGEVVLTGVVEHADGHDVAVRVELTQIGSESESSGTWSHRWEEVERRTVVAPFYVKLPDGTRVRIEPPPDVDVADDLDRKVLISTTKRIRSAELVPGETIHVRGWLERGGEVTPDATVGYRDVTWGWVLRPVRKRMMLSSRPLGEELRGRAAFHRFYGWLAILALGIVQLSLVFYYSRALGDVEPATIVAKEIESSRDEDGDRQVEHLLEVQLRDGSGKLYEVDEADYHRVGHGQTVAARRGGPDWSLGELPTLAIWQVIPTVSGVIVLWMLYHRRRHATRPWYRRRITDHGSGRLPAG
jgi:hypothetical protein